MLKIREHTRENKRRKYFKNQNTKNDEAYLLKKKTTSARVESTSVVLNQEIVVNHALLPDQNSYVVLVPNTSTCTHMFLVEKFEKLMLIN